MLLLGSLYACEDVVCVLRSDNERTLIFTLNMAGLGLILMVEQIAAAYNAFEQLLYTNRSCSLMQRIWRLGK